jgi:glycosyltransferase involved in cell wall biosynthesis
MTRSLAYVLITPARNEARFLQGTIDSVATQTVRPMKWVIVSDGSTDGTDEIVKRSMEAHPWIELVQMPPRRERHFAGKVLAFNAGYDRVKHLDYDVIASLDADISFDSEYFEFLLGKLANDPALGLAGTPFKDGDRPIYDYRFVNIEHVSGACQVFRRACFEDIAGYRALKGGAIDYVAVISSRMKGWKTRTFTEKICQHHREMGTAQHGQLRARFKAGQKDYRVGYHPLWEIFRSVYQMSKSPFILSGAALGFGYAWAAIQRVERPVSPEMVEFQRREQMERLRRVFQIRKKAAVPEVLHRSSCA